MYITHNDFNAAIADMEDIVRKGQPFAKRNKDRRIRTILRDMRMKQLKPIIFKEVWFYFKFWLIGKIKVLTSNTVNLIPSFKFRVSSFKPERRGHS